jgi:hypothetical protein
MVGGEEGAKRLIRSGGFQVVVEISSNHKAVSSPVAGLDSVGNVGHAGGGDGWMVGWKVNAHGVEGVAAKKSEAEVDTVAEELVWYCYPGDVAGHVGFVYSKEDTTRC